MYVFFASWPMISRVDSQDKRGGDVTCSGYDDDEDVTCTWWWWGWLESRLWQTRWGCNLRAGRGKLSGLGLLLNSGNHSAVKRFILWGNELLPLPLKSGNHSAVKPFLRLHHCKMTSTGGADGWETLIIQTYKCKGEIAKKSTSQGKSSERCPRNFLYFEVLAQWTLTLQILVTVETLWVFVQTLSLH